VPNRFFEVKFNGWGLLSAAATIICLLSLVSFLGSSFWMFDEMAQFRMQYAAALLVAALAFGVRRRFKAALGSAAFAALNLAIILPYCFTGRGAAPAASAGPTLRVILLNVHTENHQYDRVEQFVRGARADVLILEEVDHRWMQQLERLHDVFPWSCAEPQSDNFGIALFSRLPLTNAAIREFGSAQVPSVCAEIIVDGKPLMLVATHPVPPGSAENARLRNEQLEVIADFVAAQAEPIILVGDLNTTPWSSSFRRLVKQSGLTDSFRGSGYQPTWPAPLAMLGIPLDHCLVSPELAVVDRRRGPHVGSDHLPLLIEIQLPRP
jgi:endonuclease/exonuclease/phosphatase (EEP) superfamily protein YafD